MLVVEIIQCKYIPVHVKECNQQFTHRFLTVVINGNLLMQVRAIGFGPKMSSFAMPERSGM